MAGASIQIDIKGQAAIDKALQKLTKQVGNLKTPLREIGEHLLESTQDRFDREAAPDGKSWQELAPSTFMARMGGVGKTFKKRGGLRKAAQKKLGAMQILTDSRRLRDSIVYDADDAGLEIGTNAIYGAIHQLGGPAGKDKNVDIPARPYLGLDDDDRSYILEVVSDYLAKAV
jgi:phage gpG-like protein